MTSSSEALGRPVVSRRRCQDVVDAGTRTSDQSKVTEKVLNIDIYFEMQSPKTPKVYPAVLLI